MGYERGLSGSFRWIPEKPDHGQIFISVSYEIVTDISVGIDYRPLADDVAPNASWRLLPELDSWPALIIGTSKDEFDGEPSQSYFATLSKYVGHWAMMHVSPYAGATWIVELDAVKPVGGVVLGYPPFTAMWMYSGTDPHAVLSTTYGSHTISAIYFAFELPGLAYAWRW